MGLSVTAAIAGDDGSWDAHPESIRLNMNRKATLNAGVNLIIGVFMCVFIPIPFILRHTACGSAIIGENACSISDNKLFS